MGRLAAGGGRHWSIASWAAFSSGDAFFTNLERVQPGDTLVGVMTLAFQAGGIFNWVCEFEGVGQSILPFAGSPQLDWCTETLEAYDVTTCSDYPDTSLTRFRDISIRTGTTRPWINWSEVNAVTGCGQSARVISNSATDGEVHITYRGLVSESPWPSIGGTFGDGAPVAAVERTDNNLDLFVCGNDGRVYTAWWNDGNGWSSADDDRWKSSIGGSFPPGAPIAAITRSPNDIDLFICDSDGRVYTAWWRDGDGWSSWEAIGGSFPDAAPIAAMTRSSNDIDLFICDSDGRVYTAWWRDGDGWSSWESIGGTFPSGAPVTALSRYDNAIDLFVCGGDGHVYTAWWNDGNGWSSWADIGGTFPDAAPIAATTRSRDDIDLFICGSDGRVYTAWWRDGDGWSGADDDRLEAC